MMLYLVRMIHRPTKKICHKEGHTKWGAKNFMKRFESEEYKDFDFELLAYQYFSHENWAVAKSVITTIENALRSIWPAKDPSFMIEDYFEADPGSMKISGVTELIFLKENQTENDLIKTFKIVTSSLTKTSKELEQVK